MRASLKEKLNTLGIRPDQVRAVCCTDLDENSQVRFGFVVLTDETIIKLQNPTTVSELQAEPVCDKEAAVTIYERAKCSDIASSFHVSGISLSMMYEGEAVLLATATNRFMPEVCVIEYALKDNTVLPVKERGGSGAIAQTKTESKSRSPFVRLFGFYKPYKARVAFIFLFVLLSAVINMVTPYLSGTVLFGQVLEGSAVLGGILDTTAGGIAASLLMVVLLMLAIQLITQATYALQALCTAKITPFVVRDIKAAIFRKMSQLSLGFYHSRETGTLMTRVLDDADRVSGVLIDHMPYFVMDMLTIVSVVTIMAIMNWKMALAAFILMPLSALVSVLLMPRMFTLHGKHHRSYRKMSSHLNDNLTGSRVIRAFGQEEKEKASFHAYSEGVKDAEMDLVKTETKVHGLFGLVREMSTILIYMLGGYFILSQSGDVSYASLITFTGYAGMLAGPLEHIAFFFRLYSDLTNAGQRIFEILDTKSQIEEAQHPIRLDPPTGEVELRNVSFSYETGRPVLQNVSFHAKPGQLLGIVGYSGAGKTTLLNLISRLYDVDDGEILIDGVNIKDIALSDLRKNIAVVSQETYIFMGTVAENIAYANPDATREQIVAAAIAASAHDFIMKMPDGYDTMVGVAGRELSGGERQRISIARAILSNPKILILDEATAAVDTKTEIHIQQSIEQLSQNRTTISVAHRLSTLRNADNLVVIDKGKVVESGTHEQLMQQQGLYHQLATLQTQQMIMKGDEHHDGKPRNLSYPR